MAFDQQDWQDKLEQVDKSLTGGGEQMALDNVKNDFEHMNPDDRQQALQDMMKFNEGHNTNISLEHGGSGGDKFVADNVAGAKRALFGQDHTESD